MTIPWTYALSSKSVHQLLIKLQYLCKWCHLHPPRAYKHKSWFQLFQSPITLYKYAN